MKIFNKLSIIQILVGLSLTLAILLFPSCETTVKHKALIITGQNNHNWEKSNVILKEILDLTGVFETEILVSPASGEDMSAFLPDFKKYAVVVFDYNGDPWSEKAKTDFVNYVKDGGGLVIYHAANNAFPEWEEYNEMIGLGGWGKRDEKSGPYLYWKDDKVVKDYSPGHAGGHGEQHAYLVINRDMEHPITKGLPDAWMHSQDELYGYLRGPVKNMNVLSTAWSDTVTGGSGRNEPVLFTITYGQGRIFQTVLGHCGKEDKVPAMHGAGFITTLQRGTEWAATGNVSLPVPDNFPNSASVVMWDNFQPLSLNELMQKAGRYKSGQSRMALSDLTERIRKASDMPDKLKKYEKEMVKFLDSEATSDSKNYIMKELSWMGTKKSISVLEKLQKSEDTAEMAGFALKRIKPE